MSETILSRNHKKNISWKTSPKERPVESPVPLRKSMYFIEDDHHYEYVISDGKMEIRELVFEASAAGNDVNVVTAAGDFVVLNVKTRENPASGEPNSSSLNRVVWRWVKSWDGYDYTVVLGAILILLGLLIPVFTRDKTLTFVFPLGAACVGAGTRLARRRTLLS